MVAKVDNGGKKLHLKIYKILSNFDFDPLICYPTLYPGENSPNIAKCNRVFLGKGRVEGALIFIYLHSPMAQVFPYYCLFFSISDIFNRKRMIKNGPKNANFGSVSFSWKLESFKCFLKQCFCCSSTISDENFGNIGQYYRK